MTDYRLSRKELQIIIETRAIALIGRAIRKPRRAETLALVFRGIAPGLSHLRAHLHRVFMPVAAIETEE
jgi:hypothetical protein